MQLQSEQIGELAKALSKAQGKFEGVERDSKNPFFKSKYADLHSVFQACRGPLAENGLAITQTDYRIDGQDCIITTLMHESGQWLKSVTPLFITKRDSQGYGSSHTYAKRYALQAIVGLSSYDDDGEESMKPVREKPEAKPEQARKTLQDLLNALNKVAGPFTKEQVSDYVKYISITMAQNNQHLSEEDVIQSPFEDANLMKSFASKLQSRLDKKATA